MSQIAPDSKRSTRAGQKPQKSLGQIISETQQHGTLMPPTKTFRVPTRITPVVPEPRREPTAQPERVVIDVDGVEQDEVIILSRSTPSNRKQQDDVSDLTPEPPSGRSIRTPAGKIALDDLLGLLEDAEPKLPEGSPAEFASWLAPRSPPSSNRLNAASALRLRKRARSSSPIMSPRHQIPSSLNAADTDLPLSRDPTLEFLRMYSIRPLNHLTHDPKFQPHDTLSRGKLPGLRPQEAGSSPGLLRKIASCGPEWPSSRSKRRKLEPLYSLAGAVRQPGTDRLSMVNRLIEKMQNDEADGMVAPVADEASHQYHEIREDVEPIRYPPPPNTSRRGSGVNAAPLALAHVSHHPRPTEMALQQTASKEGQETHDDSPLAIGVINWPIFVPPPEKQEAVIKEVGTETLDAGLFDDIDFEDDTSWDIAQLGVSEAPKSPTIHVDADADADIKLAPIAAPQVPKG